MEPAVPGARRHRRLRLTGLGAGIAAALFMLLAGQSWSFLKQKELAAYDVGFSLRGPITPSNQILVIGVDHTSITNLSPGTNPVRRYWMGQAIRFLCQED